MTSPPSHTGGIRLNGLVKSYRGPQGLIRAVRMPSFEPLPHGEGAVQEGMK